MPGCLAVLCKAVELSPLQLLVAVNVLKQTTWFPSVVFCSSCPQCGTKLASNTESQVSAAAALTESLWDTFMYMPTVTKQCKQVADVVLGSIS